MRGELNVRLPADFRQRYRGFDMKKFLNNRIVALFTKFSQCTDHIFLSCAG